MTKKQRLFLCYDIFFCCLERLECINEWVLARFLHKMKQLLTTKWENHVCR